jgi:hypothetical protein
VYSRLSIVSSILLQPMSHSAYLSDEQGSRMYLLCFLEFDRDTIGVKLPDYYYLYDFRHLITG